MKVNLSYIPRLREGLSEIDVLLTVDKEEDDDFLGFRTILSFGGGDDHDFYSVEDYLYIDSSYFADKGFFSLLVTKFQGSVEDPTLLLDGEVLLESLSLPLSNSLIKVQGFVRNIFGEPVTDSPIRIALKSKNSGTEFSGGVVVRELDGCVYTDANGYWFVFLAPNFSCESGGMIYPPHSFYVFSIMGEVFRKEVSASRGLVQNFYDLRSPVEHEYRTTNLSGLSVL